MSSLSAQNTLMIRAEFHQMPSPLAGLIKKNEGNTRSFFNLLQKSTKNVKMRSAADTDSIIRPAVAEAKKDVKENEGRR